MKRVLSYYIDFTHKMPDNEIQKQRFIAEHLTEIGPASFAANDFDKWKARGLMAVVWMFNKANHWNPDTFTAMSICFSPHEYGYWVDNLSRDPRPLKFYVGAYGLIEHFTKIENPFLEGNKRGTTN